jgi:hypothetical protein
VPQLLSRVAGGILVVDANPDSVSLTTRLELPEGHPAGGSLLIYPTNLPRLNVLPAAAKLPSRGWDRSWIAELREGWSLVLLDLPSLLHPEVASLAECCDGVYLVVRLGHTSRRGVAKAARTIRRSGGRLLGCVVIE